MTRELTSEYLEELGFKDVYNWFGNWYIFRYWYNSGGKVKEYKRINVRNATCKHKYTHNKYYPILTISLGHGKSYSITLSKFLYAWFRGCVPANMDVDHKDNDPFNNYINEDPEDPKNNLQLLTRKENINKRLKDNPEGWINQHGKKKKKD